MNKDFYVRTWAFQSLRHWGKSILPRSLHGAFRPLVRLVLKLYNLPPSLSFIIFPPPLPNLTYRQRVWVAYQVDRVSRHVRCAHSEEQILRVFRAVLSLPADTEGCIVEAGSFKGGSGAKFSILAKLTNRKVVLFDSFEGLPENEEEHYTDLLGNDLSDSFKRGKYCGSLEEVQANIRKYGFPDLCSYSKGWFEDTMPHFSKKICAAYIDVDLASSTKSCLKYLYPQLVPGGTLVSQDGHIPLVVEVFQDREFWNKEVGCEPPFMEGLGKNPLVIVCKPSSPA